MKEIGEYLKEERKKNSVSISEASEDLEINQALLEAIEDGNSKAFKDVFELKAMIRSYSKYLGLNVEEIQDEFNDYMFEKTSKISLDDIKKAKSCEEKTNHVSSPYTKIKHTRYDLAPIVLLVATLLFISLIVYVVLKIVSDEPKISKELYYIKGEVSYEFTK